MSEKIIVKVERKVYMNKNIYISSITNAFTLVGEKKKSRKLLF